VRGPTPRQLPQGLVVYAGLIGTLHSVTVTETGISLISASIDAIIELESRARVHIGEGLERRDRVDATRRQEDDLRAAASRKLEAMVGADEVGLHHVVAADEHRGLGGAFDHGVELTCRKHVVEHANVAVEELHVRLAESSEIHLGSAAAEIVKRHNSPPRPASCQPDRHVAADKACAAGDQNPSRGRELCAIRGGCHHWTADHTEPFRRSSAAVPGSCAIGAAFRKTLAGATSIHPAEGKR
jgi:hypothetical protein